MARATVRPRVVGPLAALAVLGGAVLAWAQHADPSGPTRISVGVAPPVRPTEIHGGKLRWIWQHPTPAIRANVALTETLVAVLASGQLHVMRLADGAEAMRPVRLTIPAVSDPVFLADETIAYVGADGNVHRLAISGHIDGVASSTPLASGDEAGSGHLFATEDGGFVASYRDALLLADRLGNVRQRVRIAEGVRAVFSSTDGVIVIGERSTVFRWPSAHGFSTGPIALGSIPRGEITFAGRKLEISGGTHLVSFDIDTRVLSQRFQASPSAVFVGTPVFSAQGAFTLLLTSRRLYAVEFDPRGVETRRVSLVPATPDSDGGIASRLAPAPLLDPAGNLFFAWGGTVGRADTHGTVDTLDVCGLDGAGDLKPTRFGVLVACTDGKIALLGATDH